MKLASFVCEFLSLGKVSIESIFEIDNNFKTLIEKAENLLNRINSINNEQFEIEFNHMLDIHDSFDNIVELILNGSKTQVTKENLAEFIELAKNFRIHEFDQQLKEIKEGFNKIMCYKEITSILTPHELMLLACGEPNCTVEQMKKVIVVAVNDYSISNEEKENKIKMFWNVMESLSPDERIQCIKLSSGNLGLPAPVLKWEKDLHIAIMDKDFKENLPIARTCASLVDIPSFNSEDQLYKMIKIAINFAGLITDGVENAEAVAEFL